MISDSKFQLIRAANVWSGDEGWELLFYYNIYRFCLAVILLALAAPGWGQIAIDLNSAGVVTGIAGFLMVSVLALITIRQRTPAIHIQAHMLFLLDMVFISILALTREIHDASIVVLYITTVGATAVMFRTRTALAYSVIATLVIYFRDLVGIFGGTEDVQQLYLSALTAIGLFTIVFIVGRVARRTRVVQNVLEQQEIELADLDAINQLIIDQLEIGVLFIDDNLGVKLVNNRASSLIGDYVHDDKVTGHLGETLKLFFSHPGTKSTNFRQSDSVLTLHKTEMQSGIMVRIEDETVIARRIQQTKLSTVGRFASAVSHEIRNPLNAISHAAQLIRVPNDDEESQELVKIIRKHVRRINDIIESVLERSRPGKAEQREVVFPNWLENFVTDFQQSVHSEEVRISISGQPCRVYFDTTQLEQILTNICQNSVKYGRVKDAPLEILFRTSLNKDGIPYLDISNNGPRIPENQVDRLFEPFYTTDSVGTGLGLYLSREFCNLNGAEIAYFSDNMAHGFRITFQLQDSHNR